MPFRTTPAVLLMCLLALVLAPLSAHADPLAFSPDGRLLAQARESGSVVLWDVEGGTVTRTMNVGQRSPLVAFAPDGQSMATAGQEGTVILWHVATGRELHRFRATAGAVRSLGFSPDGRFLAAGGWSLGEQTVDVWDPEQHDLKRIIRVKGEELHALVFAPRGHTMGIAVGGEGRDMTRLRLVDARSGRVVGSVSDEVSGPGLCVAFSPDNSRVWVGCDGGRVVAWEVATRRPFADFDATVAAVRAMALSPDGSILVTAGAQAAGLVRFWDVSNVATRSRLVASAPVEVTVGGLAFSRDSKVLAVSGAGTLSLWDASTGKMLRSLSETR